MARKTGCKTASRKNIIGKAVFEQETLLCRKLSGEGGKKGCNWGKCGDCGVIPLLFKLHKGILIENKKDVIRIKEELLDQDA